MSRAYVAMGSNLGDRASFLERAAEALAALPGTRLLRRSRTHETEAEGGPAGQGRFLNAVVELQTTLTPRELLEALLQVERDLGRRRGRDDVRWGPRTLDLDLLLYNEQSIDQPGLMVPHPRMHERRFVLEPLAELAPDAMHPLLHKTVRELLAERLS